MSIKRIFKSARIITLLILLLISLLLIAPNPTREGAAIRAVSSGSSANLAGFIGPDASVKPLDREVITMVDGIPIKNADNYYSVISNLTINQTVLIKTNKRTYDNLIVQPLIDGNVLKGEFDEITSEVFNKTLNETVNVTTQVPKINETVIGVKDLGLSVYNAPKSNLRKGLDLQGGTRILIKPIDNITAEDFNSIKSNLETRLNLFGLSDVSVNIVKNFNFEPEYILIEIAGTTADKIEELVLSQGKFEAKIGNVTVFTGDKDDIPYVGKSATQARIKGCNPASGGGYSCGFQFQIKLSPTAAKRQAEATKNLKEIVENGQNYLEKDLDLYLDGTMVDSLKISSGLKGRDDVTDIAISGSGFGLNRAEATKNTSLQMKRLQTVIETGSLPTKLEIAKVDTISAVLGNSFLKNAIWTGIAALFSVGALLFIRYRKFKIIIPMILALISEVVILIGFYSISATLDIAAIAGIIILIGTGVDHLVVITDEVIKGKNKDQSWKTKLKGAFAIVLGAFFTTTIAMLPLLIAGAGLLKGFAITTMLGLTIGVMLTRPAYAKVIENLLN